MRHFGHEGVSFSAFLLKTRRDPGRRNSRNHEGDGQNVLYADGHVSWETSPTCGIGQDNVYTNKNGQVMASPVDRTDAVLLPAGP